MPIELGWFQLVVNQPSEAEVCQRSRRNVWLAEVFRSNHKKMCVGGGRRVRAPANFARDTKPREWERTVAGGMPLVVSGG